MSGFSDCCQRGFDWDGTPTGEVKTLAANPAYVAGTNKDFAVLFIHDLFGWTYKNNRLLADHYAKEAQATVYLPDFYGGEIKDSKLIEAGRFVDLDMPKFMKDNSKEVRGPEIFACARVLRAEYKRVVAVGFCYGGWASFQLGAKGVNLVDAITTGHPSWLTNEEIDAIDVPVQVIVPQHDHAFTQEFRTYTFNKLAELNLPFSYEYFPNVSHGFAARGDLKGEDRKALERAKDVMVTWMNFWGHQAAK